ncbi:MAG: tetratricopeptide repeat protein [Bacteroidota bacterium]
MAKKENDKKNTTLNVELALSRTEQFVEKNKKIFIIVIAAIVLVIGGYFGYKKFYLEPKSQEAQEAMFMAEKYFAKDSLKLALKGDGVNAGFIEIVDNYGMTPSGNLANYYAGICYLRLGQFQNAIDYLSEFDSDDQMLGPIALGGIGDANLELGNIDQAIEYYIQASEKSVNNFTTPIYLLKLAQAYETQAKFEDAIKIYERLRSEFVRTYEGREAEKFLARLKAITNK